MDVLEEGDQRRLPAPGRPPAAPTAPTASTSPGWPGCRARIVRRAREILARTRKRRRRQRHAAAPAVRDAAIAPPNAPHSSSPSSAPRPRRRSTQKARRRSPLPPRSHHQTLRTQKTGAGAVVSLPRARGRAGVGVFCRRQNLPYKVRTARFALTPSPSPNAGRGEPVGPLRERVGSVTDPPIPLNERINSPLPALGEGLGVRANRLQLGIYEGCLRQEVPSG